MSAYWRHVSTVFTGSLFAQSIPIIGSLAIARIFAPSEFGEFSTWLALVSFIAVVVTLRLETVLAIVEDGEDRAKAVFITLATTLSMTCILSVALYILSSFSIARAYLPEQPVLLSLIVPAAFLVALNQIWQTWAAVDGTYRKLNTMRLVQAFSIVLIQIGAGLRYPAAVSLVLGFVIASGISFVTAVILMPRFVYGSFFHHDMFLKFFLRYKKFPLYALPADSINTAVAQLPVLVVFHRFGGETAGYLALTMRVLGAPVGLVGKAILDVFKRYAVLGIRESGNCRNLYIKTFMALALASIIMVICTVLLAEDIFRVAFGDEWIQSGRMAIWLLPMFALGLVASPLSYMVYLVEKQYVDLLWQVGLMVVAMAALYGFSSSRSTLIGYGVGYAMMYMVYILISYRLSGGGN
ncbi:oligosaccharide flippase family protein [Pseudomonas sp. SG20056]|uniref:lipopolysaccharide biosynthesis protein n=1 Tax=Pseudomonas sp. SG20056 TaxID=3074146 RepID=UPI00287FCE40|nr:oligosaccharide flippase family protein [Pseudomonas sp. SG20056]WNF45442.1 oligosaccharide flippase family protein [Pseudomonas sp. SG20056]